MGKEAKFIKIGDLYIRKKKIISLKLVDSEDENGVREKILVLGIKDLPSERASSLTFKEKDNQERILAFFSINIQEIPITQNGRDLLELRYALL